MSSAGRVRSAPSGRPRHLLAPRRVGILGGSFNPAHEGHLEISRTALRRLGLDQVWWLVSPQNPLKSAAGMASLEDRMRSARMLARDPRIRVTALEQDLRTRYTADTLSALRRRFPKTRFVWLMGADNLVDISRWERWPQIFDGMPVAVLARPSYSLKSLAAKAARRFARVRLPEAAARSLAERRPPAWTFIAGRLNPLSATEIRRARGSKRR